MRQDTNSEQSLSFLRMKWERPQCYESEWVKSRIQRVSTKKQAGIDVGIEASHKRAQGETLPGDLP